MRELHHPSGDFVLAPGVASDQYLAYCAARGGATTLSSAAAGILVRCREAMGRDELEALAAGQSPAAARAAVDELVARGLLVSMKSLLDADVETAPSPPVDTILIPTRNRPEALERCVRSFAANAVASGRALEVLVVDQSDADASDENVVRLRRLREETGARVRYGGASARQVLLEHLAPFGATASFAVGAPFERIPIGANRNLGMLLAGARPFVMVDDDMVCEISATDEHPGHVAIRDSEQLHYTQHFESEEALVAASRPTSVDYLSLHESVLGRSVRDILRSAQTYTLDVFDRDAVAAFSTPSRVVASTTGCHGDIGIGQPIRLLLDPRFVEVARADYASAFASVRSRRAPASLVLRRGFASMLGGGLGLDGRELLPPFAPWFRQEDVLFSALLARTHRNDHVAGLPWSLAHRPVRAVAAAADVYDVTESPNRALFALLSASLFVEAEKDAAFGPEDVLRSASLELSALCRSTRSLQTRLDYFWSHLQASAIDSWAQVAERATEPAVRSDAERMLQGARQRFASHHQFGSEAEGSDVREYAARYGELLGAWPDLVSAAREAASSGDIAPRV